MCDTDADRRYLTRLSVIYRAALAAVVNQRRICASSISAALRIFR
jgi:hypothetical protein